MYNKYTLMFMSLQIGVLSTPRLFLIKELKILGIWHLQQIKTWVKLGMVYE